MGNNYFTICSFFYSLMLSIIYFRRKNVQSLETKVYSKIVITNFINVTFAILCYFTILINDIVPFLNNFVSKTLLLLFILWEFLFTAYLLVIISKDDKHIMQQLKKRKVLLFVCIVILIAFVYYLPLYYHSTNNVIYSYGPSANLIYLLTAVLMMAWVIIMLKNFKILKTKKCIPIILFIFLAIIAVSIQKINPGLLLITAVETFITVIMFFTIENPDMKLLEELHKSKEISDSANEEKTLFLYNMTQEIRNTMHEIDNDADIILESKDLNDTYHLARNIKATTSKFTSMANDILDVSKMDSANLKVYNSKYNIKTVIKEIVNIYDNICKKKELTFRTNIDHDIPDILYGDSINLKEVLNIILTNSCEYTDKGYIELNINTIVKNDICRLMITIEDSGRGIKSEDIDKLKVDDKSLSKARNLVTLMNGTMIISSNYGIGTKVKIILDQKIESNKNTEITKYDVEFKNTKILMVDDSESGIKIIEKLLKGTDIKIDSANNGKECLDMIKTHKYNLILLDEELSEIKGAELLKKIKDIRNFNTKVILLTKDNSYEYNGEHLNLGFADYILKPVKKEELLNKINKIVNEDN